jgi:hypothetical protein
LLCLGRHTVTGLLSTSGSQFQDWTAAYRLFSRLRIDPSELFAGIRTVCLEQLPQQAPLCISVDDSLLPKTGTKTPGVAWRRDPQGPPFHTNFIRAQRVLQFSAMMPIPNSATVRGIPIDFLHAPTAPKLSDKASDEEKLQHKKLSDQLNLSTRALEQLQKMRPTLGSRPFILLSDARFTTKRFLSGLPADITLIGRIRRDAKLFLLPTQQPARGRPRLYGARCPTPDEIRKDDAGFSWQEIAIHAAGADHQCRVKVVDDLLWQSAGPNRPLRLIVIAPLRYRPSKGARLLYRDAAFLICTNPNLSVQHIVQNYFWRWDIEVNFRDEKTLLGVGQAQVRTENSTQAVPAFQVAAYAMLLLAAAQLSPADLLPPPKWRSRARPERISTQRVLQHLRFELWGRGLGVWNSSGFCSPSLPTQNPEKFLHSLPSALFYAQA